jgi:hypothetical protein
MVSRIGCGDVLVVTQILVLLLSASLARIYCSHGFVFSFLPCCLHLAFRVLPPLSDGDLVLLPQLEFFVDVIFALVLCCVLPHLGQNTGDLCVSDVRVSILYLRSF